MVHCSLKELDTQNAKNDEECATDEDNVANGFQGADQRHDNQLHARGTVDDPERAKGTEEAKNTDDTKDFGRI
jgi:hypothetical protein